MLKLISTCILLFSFVFVKAQNKTEKYIARYSSIAIEEMNRYNIPASITLAQGILESGNGESRLATEGKNHFGIKCHKNWSGETILVDDDKKGECFRKYSKVIDSYRDHSLFLTERERYAFLFKYKRTDYKKWAKGLKKAGYATNPKYPTLLVDLIENYNLNRFDSEGSYLKNFYLGRSYGIPYLIGVGTYYFNDDLMYSLEINTSFVFSEANVGCYYKVIDEFYLGPNTGFIYLPTKDEDLVTHIACELMYKKRSVLIRGGVQYPFNLMQYNLLPLFKITYLLG